MKRTDAIQNLMSVLSINNVNHIIPIKLLFFLNFIIDLTLRTVGSIVNTVKSAGS